MTGETKGPEGIKPIDQEERNKAYEEAIRRLPSLASVTVRVPVAGGFATTTVGEYLGINTKATGVPYAGEVNPAPDQPTEPSHPNYPA